MFRRILEAKQASACKVPSKVCSDRCSCHSYSGTADCFRVFGIWEYLFQYTARHLRLESHFSFSLGIEAHNGIQLWNNGKKLLSVDPVPRKEAEVSNLTQQSELITQGHTTVSMFCQLIRWWEGPSLGAMVTSSYLLFQEKLPHNQYVPNRQCEVKVKAGCRRKLPSCCCVLTS